MEYIYVFFKKKYQFSIDNIPLWIYNINIKYQYGTKIE
jgi:hypothetical protein